MKSMSSKKQQGIGLVELLLVLAVIALIAIAAFIIYPSVQAGTQANTEASNITAIAASTKGLYGPSGSYTGLTNTTAVPARIFPSTMTGGLYASTTPVKSVWGGAVALVAVESGARFEINYTGIPAEACIKFVSAVAANFDKVGLATGGTTIKNVTGAPSPAAIVTACNAEPATIFFASK